MGASVFAISKLMAIQWFYQTSDGQRPVDSTQLRRLAEAGIVRPETLVRQGAIGSWVRAEHVQGLFLPSKPAPSYPPGTTPPVPPPQPKSGALVNEASEKPERVWPVTWAAIIVGSGTVLLLLWAVVFRGSSTPQQQADKDQPPFMMYEFALPEPISGDQAIRNRTEAAAQSAESGSSAPPIPEGWEEVTVPTAEPNSALASTDLAGTQVYEEVVGSTVTIHSFHGDTPIGDGSGFILYPGEAIVTNEHVIRGASRLVVRHHGGATAEVTVVRNVDANRDIALLPFSSDRLDSHGLVLAPNFPKVGETVYAIGAPHGLEFTFTRGIVSQVRQGFLSFGTVIQTDVSISPGSSGGPLVNGAGQVVGINTLGSKSSAEAHNLNFAIAMSEIRTVSQRSNLRVLTDLDGYRLFEKEIEQQEEIERQVQLAAERKRQEEAQREATRRRLEIEQKEREARRLAEEERRRQEYAQRSAVRDQWKKIVIGMPFTQVETLLGRPNDVSTFGSAGAACTYRFDWTPYSGYVSFDGNGRVKGWSEPRDWKLKE